MLLITCKFCNKQSTIVILTKILVVNWVLVDWVVDPGLWLRLWSGHHQLVPGSNFNGVRLKRNG